MRLALELPFRLEEFFLLLFELSKPADFLKAYLQGELVLEELGRSESSHSIRKISQYKKLFHFKLICFGGFIILYSET